MIREKLIVTGKVSEGGIRYFAQMKASSLKLTGYAKRGPEGTILIEVQGEEENISKLKEKLKIGNGFFEITNIESKEIDIIKNEKIFSIK